VVRLSHIVAERRLPIVASYLLIVWPIQGRPSTVLCKHVDNFVILLCLVKATSKVASIVQVLLHLFLITLQIWLLGSALSHLVRLSLGPSLHKVIGSMQRLL
jgi:hypothetical protein